MGDGLAITADLAFDQWGSRFRVPLIVALPTLVAGIAAVAYLVTFESSSRIHVTVQHQQRSLT